MLIDLLTLNIWGLPWPLAKARRERKRLFGEHLRLAAYDVIGIQELWWPWRCALELDSIMVPRSRRDCGLALAGRMQPRRPLRVRHYQRHVGADRIKRKGVLSTQVMLRPGLLADVYVTHLQAGPRNGAVRAEQIDELLQAIADSERPSILMGDFNFHRMSSYDESNCERLRDAGFEDAAAVTSAPTYSSTNPYVRRRGCSERFDRIYLRGGGGVRFIPVHVEVLTALGPLLSDHHPLHVRARIDDRVKILQKSPNACDQNGDSSRR